MNIRVNDFFYLHVQTRINRVSQVKSNTGLVLSVDKKYPSKYRILNLLRQTVSHFWSRTSSRFKIHWVLTMDNLILLSKFNAFSWKRYNVLHGTSITNLVSRAASSSYIPEDATKTEDSRKGRRSIMIPTLKHTRHIPV